MLINAIVAVCNNKGIGYNNTIPWYLPNDLKYFQQKTTGFGNNALVMGRKTWESISTILKNRDSLILSSSLEISEIKKGSLIKSFNNLNLLLQFIKISNYNTVWVIGGAEIYNLFLKKKLLDYIYITYINQTYECDIFFPKIPYNYKLIQNISNSEKSNNGKNTKSYIFKKS